MNKFLNIPNTNSSLQDWLLYIEQLNIKDIDLNLERVKYIASKLNLLNFTSKIFLVAGTNGKGTTCSILENIFLNSGFSVGLYTSPHLLKYNERIKINGEFLDDLFHIKSFHLIESQRDSIPLTYFEFITLSALLLFKERSLNVIIIEVGLGGRLDATNILNPDISIITNIDIDHVKFLGNNRYKIGLEKAGILRPKKYAIFGDVNITYSIIEIANSLNSKLLQSGLDYMYWKSDLNNWIFWDNQGFIDNLKIINYPLSIVSSAIAAIRVSRLPVSKFIIQKSIKEFFLPYRFQTISYKPRIILDVGHNPHAALYISSRLAEIKSKKSKIYLIIGMLKDKDIKNTLFNLMKYVDFFYCSTLHVERGATAQYLSRYLPNCSIFNNIKEALHYAIKKVNFNNDIILVFGSFISVSEAILALKYISF
ncbi:bifunctional tetrahydrofolate synthase/dihydrofolate synthase [Buchnera aphidicola (Neophyllaphis podocarpi)]|uniref:bifunctional tetrahydrofolate synthase/dihydrofolate synthase n=1 Tax=Buchnera aphidicola TaxID=9 RepID=UPI0031B87A17